MACVLYFISNRDDGSICYSNDKDSKEVKTFESDMDSWNYISQKITPERDDYHVAQNVVDKGYFYEFRWLGLTEELKLLMSNFSFDIPGISEEDMASSFIMNINLLLGPVYDHLYRNSKDMKNLTKNEQKILDIINTPEESMTNYRKYTLIEHYLKD